MSKQSVVVFIFRRDLRLEDNIPLQEALDYAKKSSCALLPVFIFTPEQVGTKAPVKSASSVACLLQSLEELNETLESKYKSKLCILYDDNTKALTKLSKSFNVIALFETKDYTPYAKYREADEEKFCKSNHIEFHTIDYLYLFAPGTVLNGSGKTYQKFTPFYNATQKLEVPKPQGWVKGEFLSKSEITKKADLTIDEAKNKVLSKAELKSIEDRQQIGGRKEGLQLVKDIPKDYEKIRDELPKQTSNLSVHHHYGTVSIRESWHEAEKKKGLSEFQRQLIWRDFYGHLIDKFDELYPKYKGLHNWLLERPKLSKEKQKQFEDWCNGTTGIELVDAGMTQLNEHHFMHNRARLVVASVLTKDWDIPWQYGAGYFAEKLLDYDYTQNTMNWLFVSERLPFSQPPFRRHDPERTRSRLDPKKEYIHFWLKK